ncbi:MAG: hypothetical protein LRY51_10680 [Geovibrio sp.]|nr:hypothetical protein [Geovibrio sp.]
MAGAYGVYARIADNLDWIESRTGELDYGNTASGGGGGGCSASENGNISLLLMSAALAVFIKRGRRKA